MNNILVTESLYLLTHAANEENTIKQELLFSSTNRNTPGQAYEISISDNNTGYSDLTFKMPTHIINKDGEQEYNPKLALIKPLSKVRYNRIIRYMGKDKIAVPNPRDEGGITYYPKNEGKHPSDYIMEDYTMDYIIQPLDKSRQNIGISLTFTAMDFPRFNLSKKKMGLTFDNNTITTPDLSLYKNKPLSSPGSVQYVRWDSALAKDYQMTGYVGSLTELETVSAKENDLYYVYIAENNVNNGIYKYTGTSWDKIPDGDTRITTWEPNPQSGTYPLTKAQIKNLVSTTQFSYGLLATIYYWPVTKTARFEGVHYEVGGFLTLSLYNTYEGSDWNGSEYLDSITWKWGYLEPVKSYLSPNTACHYLQYILKDTNWSVKGDKELLLSNGDKVYYYDAEKPTTTPVRGNYYLNFKPSEVRDGFFDLYIMRYDGSKWVDETENAFGQVVNTSHEVIDRQIVLHEDFGTLYDIDIELVEVARAAEVGIGADVTMPARYAMSVSNTNCYNAITEEARTFDLYPVFDCINRTVSLKLNAGKDFGLTYRLGSNIKSSQVRLDGEKVITKLYCTGATDAQGSKNITLGEANRIIEGVSAQLTSTTADTYNNASLMNEVHELEIGAYLNLAGGLLVPELDLSTVKTILKFPDNLGQTVIGDKPADKEAFNEILVEGSAGKIRACYNQSGADYNYIIYIDTGKTDEYKDETKQLYKYSCGEFALRRNLESFDGALIGTVKNAIHTRPETDYILFAVPLPTFSDILDGQIKFDGDDYVGFKTDVITGHKYEIDTPDTANFVLVGPDRVILDEPESFKVGTYYFINGKYYYCVEAYKHTEPGCEYQKINAIAIEGILLLEIGKETDTLQITANGKTMPVKKKDGSVVLLKEWMTNDYCIRVKYTDTALVEDGEFDPNAPEYLIGRSPYGTSYIYNFKYLFDNGWMTETDIKKIYEENKLINEENIKFYNMYSQDLINARAAYDDAINNFDLYSTKADAQLEALMSQYWANPNKASDDHFSAFPVVPQGSSVDSEKQMYCQDITYTDPTTGKDIVVKRVYYNVFDTPECNALYPHSKDNNRQADNPDGEGQYHVVLKAIGWDEYTNKPFPINELMETLPEAEDPSKTIDNYNKHVSQMKEYYYKAMMAEKEAEKAAEQVDIIAAEFDAWGKRVAEHEKNIQEQFGHLIIEGSYNNDEQPYANLLMRDSLEASDKYCTPNVTYGVNVVDAGGLLEYRTPQLLVCNDLVKKLHSAGQIVPHAGDYVSIYDEPMGMFKVAGLITKISRRVDDPYQNSITIDTSYTDADELVGNIITATNTVLSNKDIYGRAAIISNKGELSTNSVVNALSSGTDSINIVSTNGKVQVNDNGLTCANPNNTNYQMRYNGAGIFGSSNGGVTWKELMTQDGINANYISAGTINTTRVAITDGQYDITALDGNGLAVKETGGSTYKIGYFDPKSWEAKDWENLVAFVGHDSNGNGIGYFKGYVNATHGGNIGGWKIVAEDNEYSDYKYAGLYNGGTPTNPNIYVGAGLPNQTIGDVTGLNLVLKAGNKFGVTPEGMVYAEDATISGTIKADRGYIGNWIINGEDGSISNGSTTLGGDGKLTAKSGQIGSWIIGTQTETDGRYNGRTDAPGMSIKNGVIHIDAIYNDGSAAMIQLKSAGNYYCGMKSTDASFLYAGSNSSGNVGSNAPFYVNHNGYLYASYGKIGGWSLSATDLTFGDSFMRTGSSGGVCSFKAHGWFNAGDSGYWLLGNGAEYRCLIGDSYEMGADIDDSLGYVKNTAGADVIPTVGINAKNGPIIIRNQTSSIRIACMSSAGIAINAGTDDYAGAGSIQITGTNNITIKPGNKLYIRDSVAGSNRSGMTGYIKFDPDGGATKWNYAIFANGILVDVVDKKPDSYESLNV